MSPVHRFILLTDIAGSSRLAEKFPAEYMTALQQHNRLVEQAVAGQAGQTYKHTGDGYLALFESAGSCLATAVEVLTGLDRISELADGEKLQVRIALHAGDLQPYGKEYFGPALNRTSRICQVCSPGQVLCSSAVASAMGRSKNGVLLNDLGSHHLRDLDEPEQLYHVDHSRFRNHEFPPLSTLENRPNNLVRQPNSFIGRKQELAELAGFLLADTRLLTIVAPGGYGKSRLAAQLSANLLHRFENGAFMVYLSSVREDTGVPLAIASALGFQFSGSSDPVDQLCNYLQTKELLLCLDNLEHLPGSAMLVRKTLEAALRVKVVCTSREPLQLQHERICRLEPLPVAAESGEQFSEAQILFADRAALVNSSFALTPENSGQVQQVCEQLSGIPLAIELAAAWIDGFTLSELSSELSQQLELEARSKDRPERHASLKACLDWSWNLLGEEQQVILMKLSTFRGGFFSDAAREMLGLNGLALRSALLMLADKSWLYTREVDGQTRFFLRDMLAHEYAFARLEETRGADVPARDPQMAGTEARHKEETSLFEQAVGAHAEYFVELVNREGPRLHGSGTPDGGVAQMAALVTWRLELDNILEALDSGVQRRTVSWLLAIARRLKAYLERTSNYYILRDRYNLMLDAATDTGDTSLLMQARLGLARAHWRLGDYITAGELIEQTLAFSRDLGDRNAEADCLGSLGSLESDRADYNAARSHFLQALSLNRELGNRSGEAGCLNSLGNVEVFQGNPNSAREWLEQSVQLSRELGDRHVEASSLNGMGVMEFIQGNFSAAQVMFTQGLVLFQELGSHTYAATCLSNLGNVALNLDNYDAAKKMLEQALTLQKDLGDRNGQATTLNILGVVEYMLGNHGAAQELFEQTLELCRELGSTNVMASCIFYLGIVKYMQSDFSPARDHFEQALKLYQKLGNKPETSATCAIAGSVIAALGRPDAGALALFGGQHAAAGLDHGFDPPSQQVLDSGLARLETAVGSGEISADQFSASQVKGEAMDLDELAEFVLAELQQLQS